MDPRSLVSLAVSTLCLACGSPDRDMKQTGGSGLGSDTDASSGTTTDDSGGSGDSAGEKLDVGDDGMGGPGDCMGGSDGETELDFSYIWIANNGDGSILSSGVGSVSKVDTETGVELGRYITDPNIAPRPSRTAVNLYGDAVVLSRGKTWSVQYPPGPGAVTKIAARLEDCVDKNNDGTIQTSTGPEDVLEFGEDECVLWHTPIDSAGYEYGPRPVGWEGAIGQNGCIQKNPRLWIGWYDLDNNLGKFARLSGSDGSILDEVSIPWSGLPFGPYGGAVDGDGNFWAVGWQGGPLVRINGDTLDWDRWEFPTPPGDEQSWSYGMALDPNGHPWIASMGTAVHFNPDTETWSFVATTNLSMRGVMVDREGRAFYAVDAPAQGAGYDKGIAVIDTKTDSLIADFVPIVGAREPVGISIDYAGYVWVVDKGSNSAFKLDPDTYQVVLTVEGFDGPYTYSDMTGAGLDLVTHPPQG